MPFVELGPLWEWFEVIKSKLYNEFTVVKRAGCTPEHVEDRNGVVVLHKRVFVEFDKGQGQSEKRFVTFQEEDVPESDDGCHGETVDEDGHEPVKGEEGEVDVLVFEVRR